MTTVLPSSIRWVTTDSSQRLRVDELERRIGADRDAGALPFLVVGTAGNVSTGAVDPLREIAAVAARERLWFHVDGAYGAPALLGREYAAQLRDVALADSLALDPHKWLGVPVEAGLVLVRRAEALRAAFQLQAAYVPAGQADFDEVAGPPCPAPARSRRDIPLSACRAGGSRYRAHWLPSSASPPPSRGWRSPFPSAPRGMPR